MEILQIIGILAGCFLTAYLVVGAVHLVASHRQDSGLRRRTKGWLMPLLAAAFCCAAVAWEGGVGGATGAGGVGVAGEGAACISWAQALFVVTLALYWAGDVLLSQTARGGKKFVAGGACFGAAHALTVAVLLGCADVSRLRDPVLMAALAVVAAAYVVMVVAVSRHMRTFLKRQLKVPIVCYMAANAVMNVAAAVMALTLLDGVAAGEVAGMAAGAASGVAAPSGAGFAAVAAWESFAGIIAWLGAVCFFVSDTVLMSVRFNECSRFRTHTPVMATYLAAALLLAVAVLLAG